MSISVTDNDRSRSAAVHAHRQLVPDADFELGLADFLRDGHTHDALMAVYARFVDGETVLDGTMRRAVWRASVKRMGNAVTIGCGTTFTHAETFSIGAGVFIGKQAIFQGCPGGRLEIGDRVWIGPQSYFDARNVILEDHVGWGPGAKILCSAHTALPMDVPIIETDLESSQVRIGARSDIGVNAIILPGVTIGEDCIIGAGAVVTKDIPPRSVAAGVPALVLRSRDE